MSQVKPKPKSKKQVGTGDSRSKMQHIKDLSSKMLQGWQGKLPQAVVQQTHIPIPQNKTANKNSLRNSNSIHIPSWTLPDFRLLLLQLLGRALPIAHSGDTVDLEARNVGGMESVAM